MGAPAAGEAAAEGATPVTDMRARRGHPPGKRSQDMSKAVPRSAVTTRPAGPWRYPRVPGLFVLSQPCLLCQQSIYSIALLPGGCRSILSPADRPCPSRLFHTGQGTSSHFSSAVEAFAPLEHDVSRANTCQVSAGGSGVTGTLPRGCPCLGGCSRRGGEGLCLTRLLRPPPAWDLLLSFSSALETELNYGYFNVR